MTRTNPKRGLAGYRETLHTSPQASTRQRSISSVGYPSRTWSKLIAKRKVEVLAPDGATSHHLTHADAHFKVAAGNATWIGSNYKTIQLIDQRVLARGVCGFDTEWRVKRSGIYGPTVWQMETSQLRA